MDSDVQKLQNSPSLKLSRYSDGGDDLQYTSLKDILLNSPSYSDFNEFKSSDISIRNELVKRAASAYLQSAVILATRNQSCFVSFWARLRNKLAVLRSCWRIYVVDPIGDCLRHVFGIFSLNDEFLR